MLTDSQVGIFKDRSAAAMSTFGDILPAQAAGLLSSFTASRSDSWCFSLCIHNFDQNRVIMTAEKKWNIHGNRRRDTYQSKFWRLTPESRWGIRTVEPADKLFSGVTKPNFDWPPTETKLIRSTLRHLSIAQWEANYRYQVSSKIFRVIFFWVFSYK